jgi:hypothetical protein
MTMVTGIASLLAVCTAGLAFAGESPCANDVARLCSDVVAGGGRVLRCLEAHREELSPHCRATSGARLAALARRHPCATDRERFCATVPTGDGRILACLRSHAGDLSPSCQSALAPRAGRPAR